MHQNRLCVSKVIVTKLSELAIVLEANFEFAQILSISISVDVHDSISVVHLKVLAGRKRIADHIQSEQVSYVDISEDKLGCALFKQLKCFVVEFLCVFKLLRAMHAHFELHTMDHLVISADHQF